MIKRVLPPGRQAVARAAGAGLRALACAAAALLAMPDALALTIGRVQGTPLIGRPLQVWLPVRLQAGEELTCVRAELQQPELAPIPLTWRLEPQVGGGAVLRLASAQPVQEPVVTLRVVIGCSDQLTQGYVLLADPPTQGETAPPLVDATAAATPATAAPAARPATAPASVARQEAPRRSSAAVTRAPGAAPQPRTTGRAPAAPARQRAPEAEGRPRLQLDLLDIAIDQAPVLAPSSGLSAPAAGSLPRPQAAAAWQRIDPPAGQQLAAAREQNEAVQAELRALREQTRQQSEQLQRLVEERNFTRDILAGLAGAIALGLVMLLWRRSRESSARPWWQRSRTGAPAPRAESSFVDSSFPDEEDVPVRLAPEPDSDWAGRAPAAGVVLSRGPDSGYGRSRLPTAEELLDVQEKANFFIAVGQPDKAIELLESRLVEHLGASPFLWLDLLDLCRRLDRRDDYERVREKFQQAFAARMPRFDEAQPNSEGLERYPKALSRIELLWPSSRVLKEIERSLFDEPASDAIMFDLEASRELLLLYSIVLDVVTAQDDGRPYDKTYVSALETDASTVTQPVPLMALDSLPGSPGEMMNLGLDVDLDLEFAREPMLPELDLDSLGPATAEAPGATREVDIDLALDLDLAQPFGTAVDK